MGASRAYAAELGTSAALCRLAHLLVACLADSWTACGGLLVRARVCLLVASLADSAPRAEGFC